jgi:dimethylglycine dehydrogenase
MILGSGPAQQYHERCFRQQPARVTSGSGPPGKRVTPGPDPPLTLRGCGPELTGPSIAGPNARAVLDEPTDFDVSNEAFSFLDFRDTWVGRVTFTGDLGYEIWRAASFQQQSGCSTDGRSTRCGSTKRGVRGQRSIARSDEPYEANRG